MPESAAAEAAPAVTAPLPAQEWRAPVIVQLKALVFEAAGILIATVFFPAWAAIPVSVLLALWGIGMCARRPQVILDPGSEGTGPADGKPGLLTIRLGLITRRIPVSEIEAVVLDQAKIMIRKSGGTAISFYTWRKSKLDGWLKVPDVSSDVAHAISKAATAAAARNVTESPVQGEGKGKAKAVFPEGGQPPSTPRRTSGERRSANNNYWSLIVLELAGALEIAAAVIVKVHWGNTTMTVLSIIVALALGFTGVFTLVFTLWTYLAGVRRQRAR